MIFEICEVYGDLVIKLYNLLPQSDVHGHGFWFGSSHTWSYTGLGVGGEKYSEDEVDPNFLKAALVELFEQGDMQRLINDFYAFEARK